MNLFIDFRGIILISSKKSLLKKKIPEFQKYDFDLKKYLLFVDLVFLKNFQLNLSFLKFFFFGFI